MNKNKFKEAFYEFENQYVLIGGMYEAANNLNTIWGDENA